MAFFFILKKNKEGEKGGEEEGEKEENSPLLNRLKTRPLIFDYCPTYLFSHSKSLRFFCDNS